MRRAGATAEEVAKGMADAEGGEVVAEAGAVSEGAVGSMEVSAVQAVVVLDWVVAAVAMDKAAWVVMVEAVKVEMQAAVAEVVAEEVEVAVVVRVAGPVTALAVVAMAEVVAVEDAALRSLKASQRLRAVRRRRRPR